MKKKKLEAKKTKKIEGKKNKKPTHVWRMLFLVFLLAANLLQNSQFTSQQHNYDCHSEL